MEKFKELKAQARRRRKRALLAQSCLGVLIVALVFGISYTFVKMLQGQPLIKLAATHTVADTLSAQPAASEAQEETETLAAAPVLEAQLWNTLSPLTRTINFEMTDVDSRMLALPANGRVSNEYFRTALFIGDSLSQGFGCYEPLRNIAQFCTYKSIGPKAILENVTATNVNNVTEPMWDAICEKQPDTIYLLLGTNALIVQEDDAFLHYYGQLMDALRQQFPTVPIYVQSITPVTSAQEEAQPRLANSRIRRVNNAIAQMAVSKGLYYLEVQEVLADDTGCLRADYVGTYDGIHLNPTGYAAWVDYLATHTAYSSYNVQFVVEEPYT